MDNQLKIINFHGQLVADSREVAEMIDKQHSNLIRDIRNYEDILTNSKMNSLNFFIGSTYQDVKGETRPCYLLTRKGCDMVANKMTGEKGVIFTATYVTRFEEMEKKLNKPACLEDIMIKQLEEQKVIKSRLSVVEHKVDEQMTIDYGQQRLIQKAVGRKVYERIEQNYIPEGQTDGIVETSAVRKYFNSLYKDLKNRFGIPSYRDIKRKDYSLALNYINSWIEPQELREETA